MSFLKCSEEKKSFITERREALCLSLDSLVFSAERCVAKGWPLVKIICVIPVTRCLSQLIHLLWAQWTPPCMWHNCFLSECRALGTSNLTLRPFLIGEYWASYLKWLLERRRAEDLIPSAGVCRGLSGSWRLSLHQWVKDWWLYDYMSYREMMEFGKGEFALVTCLPSFPLTFISLSLW